ncbi:MAG TPA: hypothetical protein VJ959_07060 [Desulfotignum sp.]|nr:hypothetical protein [Desulfotignum sp.]
MEQFALTAAATIRPQLSFKNTKDKLIHIKELAFHLYYLDIEMNSSRPEILYDRLTQTTT